MSSALLGSAWRTATPAAPDTVMNRPSRDLMNEVFPGVAVADGLAEFGTLLAIDGARRRLGYEPAHSWRDPIDGNHVDQADGRKSIRKGGLMRVVVIGATGHIGTYLVPRLVAQGHEVVAVSRGESAPYQARGEWRFVERCHLDREEAEREGTFGRHIADSNPDVVIDLICFRLESCRHLAEALVGKVQHFLHCGTIWVHGPPETVPTLESVARRPFGEYGRQKAAIETYLLDKARREGFPATVLHPGHIVGPGWVPINPAGNLDPAVFEHLARGETVVLPERGLATLHHVHADDVAQAFERALNHWSVAVGESFHVVSPQAVTLQGYARAVARWFGREAQLEFLPWDAWHKTVPAEHAAATLDHIAHSPNASIHKAQHYLGYAPRYTSFEAVCEALQWLVDQGRVHIGAEAHQLDRPPFLPSEDE